jgi:hypothetical protein
LQKTLAVACATALGLVATSVSAENLDLDEMAAALALPIITDGFVGNPLKDVESSEVITLNDEAVTLITITNGKSDPIILKVDMISGDVNDPETGGNNWQSTSFDCPLTGRETTTFVFKKFNSGAAVYVECSDLDNNDPEGAPKALFTNFKNGILFVAVADPSTGVISEDIIFGDAIVVDISDGEAFSFGAIPFQAGSGLNDGDKVYRFDGDEYVKFPAVLATNFLAPTNLDEALGEIRAELILFTLDGTVGNIPTPRVKIGGFAYNDDEMPFDFSYEFDCFDIVALEEINANFIFDPDSVLGLGSMSGHIEMTAQIIASTGPDAHDAQYGDGNSVRKRGFHGWIIQKIFGTFVHAGHPIDAQWMDVSSGGDAAWGRPLAQSTTDLIPFLADDDATLDADTRN